ncbi:unnamed protein product [Peniophora sp. CBMAI 1063]|nr:unnamed protein product [Peniophora sp. CBMAI 1063]
MVLMTPTAAQFNHWIQSTASTSSSITMTLTRALFSSDTGWRGTSMKMWSYHTLYVRKGDYSAVYPLPRIRYYHGTDSITTWRSEYLSEHRLLGESDPYYDPPSTVQSLQILTPAQSFEDLEYFVRDVKFPPPIDDPNSAPYVLVGSSYSGGLTAWIMAAEPDLFAAGRASSAVGEVIV